MAVSIDNVVNVNIQLSTGGITTEFLNNILYITNEVANTNDYQFFTSVNDVEAIYGNESKTYKDVRQMFSQNPSLSNTRAGVIVAEIKNSFSQATNGSFLTADFTSNLTNFQGTSDGAFDIQIGSDTAIRQTIQLTDLDFTIATTTTDISNIILRAINNLNITKEFAYEFESSIPLGSKIRITDLLFSVNSEVKLLSPTSGTDLTGVDYLDVGSGTSIVGTDATSNEITSIINNVINNSETGFGRFVCGCNLDRNEVESIIEYLRDKEKIYMFSTASLIEAEDFGTSLVDLKDNFARLLYYSTQEGANNFVMSYISLLSSINYSGVNTDKTFNLKPLSGLLPDKIINDSLLNLLKSKGVDVYASIAGNGAIFVSGENLYLDIVSGLQWFKTEIQAQVYNALQTTNTKIPQTIGGVESIKSVIEKTCITSVNNGFVGPGTWNGINTIGTDPNIHKDNISTRGYYIYAQPLSSQTQAQREERVIPNFDIAIKLTGAVHSVNIIILVEQ